MILNNNWMQLYIHAGKQQFKVVRVCHSQDTANRFLAVTDQTVGVMATDENNLVYITDINPERW